MDNRSDAVDRFVAAWASERPDLELRAMATIGRLGRVTGFVRRQVEAELAKFDLAVADFDVLATLRRAGPPYRVTPTQLYKSLMLTSGTMTSRLDSLEQRGLVERTDDPADRRGILVTLTPAGLDRLDAAVTAHVANEARILSALTRTEQSTLDAILRKLLASFDPESAPGEAKPRGSRTAARSRRKR
jgi:DNA-binding MarR family transcriptional regulator